MVIVWMTFFIAIIYGIIIAISNHYKSGSNFEGISVGLLSGRFDIIGKVMRGWVMVEPEGVDEDDDLSEWVNQAVKFVRTLPAK